MHRPGWPSIVLPADRGESGCIETMGQFVRELSAGIADAGDADQWAVAVEGVDDTGRPSLQDIIPRWWLSALDGQTPATHRVALPLRSGYRALGVVQLESWKPGGFRDDDLLAAHRAAHSAARLLDMLIPAPVEQIGQPADWTSAIRSCTLNEGGA